MNDVCEQEILKAFQDSFQPPFAGEIYDWANQNVNLQSGYSITGMFDVSISPHLKKIFEAYKDNAVREINILAPPRSGKTMCAELCLLHTIAHNSGDAVWFQLSDEMASKMVDLRLMPLIKSCKPVQALLSDDKYNLQNQKFKFAHSTIHFTSPKVNSLNSVGYRYIFMDESWRYDQGIIREIKRRADDYKGISKIMVFSQGGTKDSAWFEQYKLGTQYEYGFRCPQCSELQTFEFSKKRNDGSYSGLVWSKDLKDVNGDWDIKACAKDAKLECYHCKHQVIDTPQNRKQLLDNGDYVKVADGDDSTVKSFRFTNLVNIKISFADLVTRFLQAQQKRRFFGSTEDLESFQTKDMADFWDESVKKSRVAIQLADYDTNKPFGEHEEYRFMAVDCQDSEPFFYYGVRAFMRNGDSRLVAFGKCNTWAEVDTIRQRHNVDYRFVGVDSGQGTKTESIYAACAKYGRWANIGGEQIWACYMSLKGGGQKGFRHEDGKFYRYNVPKAEYVGNPDNENRGEFITHVTWSNLRYKTILETLRDGKGKCKWEAADVTEEYTTHLNSEVLQRKLKGNTADFEYVCKPNTPNHFWDVENMILVMADLCGCLETAETQKTDNN